MPRRCSVCRHPNRNGIETDLVSGQSYRNIGETYGLSAAALSRHRNSHLPEALSQGLEIAKEREVEAVAQAERARQTVQADHALDVVRQLRAINATCLEVLQRSRESEAHGLSLRAVDRIHRQIALQARLLGEMQDTRPVHLAVAPEWQSLRRRIVEALQPFPEARRAVVDALQEVAP